MTKKIILRPEFVTGPLWWHDQNWESYGTGGPFIDIGFLPLSAETDKRLHYWQLWYDSIFDSAYPPDSHFRNKKEQEAFEEEGVSLLRQLQFELGDDYQVFYRSVSTNKIISVVDLE